MSETMHRTQLLLKPTQYQALRTLAQQEQRSISEIVREILDQYLEENDQRTRWVRRSQALQRLSVLRARVQKRTGVYTGDLVAGAREERDEDLARIWQGKE
ncbi:MAG TPA: ribbon-helix-helix protein, CopG family [Anaerolineales bacterium]|jgi:predicted DNA-binding protein|nr:ribbon-helix-helix protein, CopG family [Anaerolineales bacterium]